MTKSCKNFISHAFQTTMKLDATEQKTSVSKAETLYVSLMCLVVSCLSFATLEVGARSPLGHSVTKSATFNALFRRNYNTKINIPTGNFVSALTSTIILAFGEKFRIPYLYLPWLANTLRGMVFHEGPALLGFSYTQLAHAIVPASTFAFITLILFVEQLCLWCDVFSSFKRCWTEYLHGKTSEKMRTKADPWAHDALKTILKSESTKKRATKAKIYDTNVDLLHKSLENTHSLTSMNIKRAKSLLHMNYGVEKC